MPDIYVFTSRGGRETNEDFVGYAETSEGEIFVLCDGLGDAGGSDYASRIVADAIIEEPYVCVKPERWLDERLRLADARVKAEQKRMGNSMKSTAVALRLDDDRAVWAHAGDSRLYYIRDDSIADVTADHTVAFKKYLEGRIRRSELSTDPDRNTITCCVGGEDELRPDFGSARVGSGDGFVLCSDGVWKNLLDQEIAFDYLKADSAERWAELILLRVMERMKPEGDNLSIITVIV